MKMVWCLSNLVTELEMADAVILSAESVRTILDIYSLILEKESKECCTVLVHEYSHLVYNLLTTC
jgi:hypothetical protein